MLLRFLGQKKRCKKKNCIKRSNLYNSMDFWNLYKMVQVTVNYVGFSADTTELGISSVE